MKKRQCRPAIILLETREKLAGWIYLPIYLLILAMLLSIVFMLLGWNVQSEEAQLHMNAVYGAINFLVLAVLFRRYLIKSARQARLFPGRFFASVFIGFAIYYGATTLVILLSEFIAPGLENVNDANIKAMSAFGVGEMAIYAILLAPLAEECLFRGLIFTSLRKYNRFLAYLVSMCAFSLIHVVGYVGSYSIGTLALCFLQYLPAGFALSWTLEYSGSIWGSIGVHMLANAFATFGMIFAQ